MQVAMPAPVPVQLALPPDSNLVLIETRHAAVTPDARTDVEASAPRPRRARPPRPTVTEEPLQIVETRKE